MANRYDYGGRSRWYEDEDEYDYRRRADYDYDRYRRGQGSADFESERGNYGRGQYDRGQFGRGYEQERYGRGQMEYGRGYEQGRYGRGAGRGYEYDEYERYGRPEYGRGQMEYGRGYKPGRYRRGSYGRGDYGQGRMDYGGEYGDYGQPGRERGFTPTSWSYTEYWLIPGPYTGQGPEGYQRSSERITEDVNERLTQHGQLNASNVRVECDENGVVSLKGQVNSRREKRMAEDLVESVSGVRDVRNELEIQEEQQQEQQQEQSQRQGQNRRKRQTQQAESSE